MRIFVVMAHFDPRGEVAPHVRRHVESLVAVAEKLVIVSTADLTPESEQWFRARATLIRRANFGYDFFSYRAGLLASGTLESLHDYDRVVICNDTFVGPVNGYEEIFSAMTEAPCDFWGLTGSTRVGPHVQSFFVCYMPWVVRSQAFSRFWLRMTPLSDRREVIVRYEVGMSRTLEEAGFTRGVYFAENADDVRLARRRVRWWAWLRVQDTPRKRKFGRYREKAAEAWNPCAGLADRVLDEARLPIVKIDTLRYDPYGLGSDRLLAACEAKYPESFAGVREYLEQTRSFYPHRKNEQMPEPIAPLRPLRSLVQYA